MARLLKSNGETSVVEPSGSKFTLGELYGLVNCDTVEVVRVPDGTGLMLWVDEDGLANSKPFNRNASLVAKRMIVGDALLTSYGEVD